MNAPYSEKVLKHFRNPRNVGRLEEPDGKGIEGSPACGDMVEVTIKVDARTKRITDIRFLSYGCASNIATGSIVTELARGKTIEEAKRITWKEAAEALGGLPPIKAHCSVLAVTGLRASIRDYEERNGITAVREPTTPRVVMDRLKHVMNPQAGLDIVRTGLVKSVEVGEGTLRVTLALSDDHMFAAAVRADVIEKLAALWDIEQVVVEFSSDS